MRYIHKITLYLLIAVFAGVSIIAVGLLLHSGLGGLLLFIGLVITSAALFVWSSLAIGRANQTPQPTSLPDELEEILEPASNDIQQVGNQNSSELDTKSRGSPFQGVERQPVSHGSIYPQSGESLSEQPPQPVAVEIQSEVPPSRHLGDDRLLMPGSGNMLLPALRLHIDEEPLTVQHLLVTLSTLLSLYVKLWLLQQKRFDDFIRYTDEKDPRFEKEANLLIAELDYHSPFEGAISLVRSPHELVIVLQRIINKIAFIQKENVPEEYNRILQEWMKNLLKTEEMFYNLPQERKRKALESLKNDTLLLAEDLTVKISVLPAATKAQHTSDEPVEKPTLLSQILSYEIKQQKVIAGSPP